MELTNEQLRARIAHYRGLEYRYGMSGNPKHEAQYRDDAVFLEELLANREAQPVLYASEETLAYAKEGEKSLVTWSEPMGDAVIPLYAAPPAPAVPAEMSLARAIEIAWKDSDIDSPGSAYRDGWNACRAAMLAAAPEGGNGA